MADNIDVTPGVGKTVVTDEIAALSGQVQVVKLGLGLDGVVDTFVDSGQQTMANSVPVALANNQSIFGGIAISARQDPGLSADIRSSIGKLSAGIGATSASVNSIETGIGAISADTSNLPLSTDLEGGGKISVGTTAVESTFTATTKAIIITADLSNTGTLYVGKSNVTSAGVNAITFLEAGEHLIIDYNDNSNALYVVASAASQNFWKGAVA